MELKNLLIYIIACFISIGSYAQTPVNANAGADKTICPGATTSIGGTPTASGGLGPYTVSWSPTTGLSSSTAANPNLTISASTTYTVTVKDSKDSTDTDIVTVFVDPIGLMGANPDKDFCLAQGVSYYLGNSYNNTPGPYTFLWTPSTGLSSTTDPSPISTTTVTTTYTVQITSPTCGVKTDQVTVAVHTLSIDAGNDTTIYEGQTISLLASPVDSIYTYWWGSSTNSGVMYSTTYNPDVSPTITTNYVLAITDEAGCVYYDNVTVEVIPSDDLVFYSVITPNGDGENDTWVVKNLGKYPDNKLEIYNRYGQQVFSVHKYQNDWNGKYLGNTLPAGTYFYLLDTNSEKGKFKGSITIFR